MRGDTFDDINTDDLVAILRAEIRRATGCTEVASAALAAARAVEALGRPAEHIHLSVSPNVYKNGVHVAVPGTPFRGLAAAAALGAAIGDSSRGLEILDAADARTIEMAAQMLSEQSSRANFSSTDEALYLRAAALAGNDVAVAIIAECHDRIVEVRTQRYAAVRRPSNHGSRNLCSSGSAHPYRSPPCSPMSNAFPSKTWRFLLDAAKLNAEATRADLAADGSLGTALHAVAATPRTQAQAWAGAASEARMAGLPVPVAAITGSGNHGIANFLGVWGYAQAVGADRERTARALAIASLVTIAIKAHTGKLTAFCGCAIAPATGLAAAAAYLMGGNAAVQAHAMQSVIGILCRNAVRRRETVVRVQGHHRRRCGDRPCRPQPSPGPMFPMATASSAAPSTRASSNLGRLNDPGMRATEQVGSRHHRSRQAQLDAPPPTGLSMTRAAFAVPGNYHAFQPSVRARPSPLA